VEIVGRSKKGKSLMLRISKDETVKEWSYQYMDNEGGGGRWKEVEEA